MVPEIGQFALIIALLLALTWKRFNTTGAVTGVLLGVISSVGLVLVGPDVKTSDHRPTAAVLYLP